MVSHGEHPPSGVGVRRVTLACVMLQGLRQLESVSCCELRSNKVDRKESNLLRRSLLFHLDLIVLVSQSAR